jgi:outer membrane protein OmpA-like peptidoglycan-associated protein
VNNTSRKVMLEFAALGLLCCTACTAEKSSMKNEAVSSVPIEKSEGPVVQVPQEAPKIVDGVFAESDHLQAVYFDLNQSKLSEQQMDVLKTNAEWLKSQPPFLVRIIGYADNRGSAKKNERLAALRAKSVREAYMALGLPKDRMSIAGHVEEVPACQPMTEECLSKARRSDTLIEDKSLASR